jgi:tRNA (guanine37-N1)-methyltransferase
VKFSVITLFPEYFDGPFKAGILNRAVTSGRVAVELVALRDFGEGRHRVTDDYPFGGGAGMVMKPGPVVAAIETVRDSNPGCRIVLLTPQGALFRQGTARGFAHTAAVGLVCGRYEGFDERIRAFCDDEVSIGDFVLMGGEAAALAVIEATTRLLPGVLGAAESPLEETLSEGLLEYPQYTRPRVYRSMEVPAVLLGGDHAKIAAWRRRQAVARTVSRRPDLLGEALLSEEERELVRRSPSEGDPA